MRSWEEPGLPVILTVLGSPPWPVPGIVMVIGLPMAEVVFAEDTITILIPLVPTVPDMGNMFTVDVGVPATRHTRCQFIFWSSFINII